MGATQLQSGDHIIVYRESGVIHHGIYVGENKEGIKSVIHFIRPDEKTRVPTTHEKPAWKTFDYPKNVQNGDTKTWLDLMTGIYVGENKEGIKRLIQFIGSDEKTRVSTTLEKPACQTCDYPKNVQNGDVTKTCLDCFISDCSVKVKEYPYGTIKPCGDVVYTAYYLLQNGFGKNGENCEDFAIFCKTGEMNTSYNFEEVVTVSSKSLTIFGGLFKFESFKSVSKRRIM